MEDYSVFSKQQLKEIIYEVVSECFDYKINHSFVGGKPEEEGFYDRDEICELLHITYPTLWRIEKTGILKSQKVGRKKLYPKKEVNLLIKSGKLAKYNHRK